MAVKKKDEAKDDVVLRLAGNLRSRPGLSDEVGGQISALRKKLTAINNTPRAAGNVGPELPLDLQSMVRLLQAAAVEGNNGLVMWSGAPGELLVVTAKVSAELSDGFVLITVPVYCAESGDAAVQVPFAIGDKDNPAGMFMATEDRPRGPAVVVDAWSEPLIAFAWEILMRMLSEFSRQAGADQDGAGLIPAAVSSTRSELRVLTMARHTFDRVKR